MRANEYIGAFKQLPALVVFFLKESLTKAIAAGSAKENKQKAGQEYHKINGSD